MKTEHIYVQISRKQKFVNVSLGLFQDGDMLIDKVIKINVIDNFNCFGYLAILPDNSTIGWYDEDEEDKIFTYDNCSYVIKARCEGKSNTFAIDILE